MFYAYGNLLYSQISRGLASKKFSQHLLPNKITKQSILLKRPQYWPKRDAHFYTIFRLFFTNFPQFWNPQLLENLSRTRAQTHKPIVLRNFYEKRDICKYIFVRLIWKIFIFFSAESGQPLPYLWATKKYIKIPFIKSQSQLAKLNLNFN